MGEATSTEPTGIRTYIEELDKLLGIHQPPDCLPFGTTILLRGGPGSGKTTLALQIVGNFIHKGEHPKKRNALFISCEQNPNVVATSMRAKFPAFHLPVPSADPNISLMTREFAKFTDIDVQLTGFIVVDSLNAVLTASRVPGGQNMITRFYQEVLGLPASPSHEEADRTLLYQLVQGMKKKFPTSVILFTGEEEHVPVIAASESFLCDVEIFLGREAVSGPKSKDSAGGTGYAVERRLTEKAKDPEAVEVRSFCRVLKCRPAPNQSRRCCYEIQPGKGLVFYENYPGDGRVMLFAENVPQRVTRDQFFQTDIPHNYPALRAEDFDHRASQRTFASQRGFRYMPHRTDLALVSYDTYWVQWFLELYQKWEIGHKLNPTFRKQLDKVPEANTCEKMRKLLPRLVCDTHRACFDQLDSLKRTDAGPAQNRPPDRISAAIRDSVKAKFRHSLNADDIRSACLEQHAFTRDAADQRTPEQISEAVYDCLKDKLGHSLTADDIRECLKQHALNKRPEDHKTPEQLSQAIYGCVHETVERSLAALDAIIFDNLSPWENIWDYMQSEQGRGGLLKLIPLKSLRLFGELRSNIIWELGGPLTDRDGKLIPDAVECENVHRDSIGGRDWLRSVPFNANVSFLLQRQDLNTRRHIVHSHKAIARVICEIFEEERELLTANLPTAAVRDLPNKEKVKTIAQTLAGELTSKKPKSPKTWEQVIALCRIEKAKLLIETQTFDTFLCFFLELVWGCGGKMRVLPDYTIEGEEDTKSALIQALCLLLILFRPWKKRIANKQWEDSIVPHNCSVEPGYMGEMKDKWLFARHWHSTFVDVLTHRGIDPHSGKEEGNHVWKEKWKGEENQPRLDVLPLPNSLLEYRRIQEANKEIYDKNQQSGDNNSQREQKLGVSSWGEWHFAMLAGSENESLGLDIINNLLSSHKICERAEMGAAVPTVEEFYKLFGNSRCFDFPERSDLELPRLTYKEFREKFFRIAKSRSNIFDYRHCMREIYAVLKEVHANPKTFGNQRNELAERIQAVINEIKRLAQQDVLTS
jgi:hypothetical protein